jgi:hypothetical protein
MLKKVLALAVGLGLVAAVGTTASAESLNTYPPRGWHGPVYHGPVYRGGWGYGGYYGGYYGPYHRIWVPGYWAFRPWGRVWIGGYWR